MRRHVHIVADACRRVRRAVRDRVYADVLARYAGRWTRVSLTRQMLIRRCIEREVERRLRDLAPPAALY